MSDVTQPGVTGRKARGTDAPRPAAAGAAPPVDPAVPVAEAGTASEAAQAAQDPVVIGAGPVPVEPGGPGAGAAQTAEAVEVAVTRTLDPAAEAALGLRPLTESERTELEQLRRERASGGFGDTAVYGSTPTDRRTDPRLAAAAGVRPGFPVGAGLVVDASAIPGRRLARAVTTIRRDGRVYLPSDETYVPLDFEGYTELVQIGAILDTPWDMLEPVAD